MFSRSAEILDDTQVKNTAPGSRQEEVEVHKDMSIDELIQASEEMHNVDEDLPGEEKTKAEVRYW